MRSRAWCAATLLLVALASPSASAEECDYWNVVNGESVVFSEDDRRLVHTVPDSVVISCEIIDNRLARGPFPLHCTNGETEWDSWYSFFPDADGNIGAILLYLNTVWYRRCDGADN